MRYILLCGTILFSHLHAAQAASPIKICFEKEKTNGAISFCLSMANKDREEIRKLMENELVDMINDNLYIPPPKYADIDDLQDNNKIVTGADKGIQKGKISENFLKERRYQLQKRDSIDKLRESEQLFMQYRKVECERRKERLSNNIDNPFLSTLNYKVCLYEMTNQRIGTLQKSIE